VDRTCGMHGGGEMCLRGLGLEALRALGRPRRRWENNFKMDLGETGIGGANWIRPAWVKVRWRAFVNTVMNLRVP
jgi:hypothetical protein